MPKRLVTDEEIKNAHREGKTVWVDENTIFTPLAKDTAKKLNVTFTTEKPDLLSQQKNLVKNLKHQKITIGADHGGFEMKEILKDHIRSLGYEVKDLGTYSEESVDYPDYAFEVAKSVSEGKSWRGIIVDGVGIGSDMAANKVHGIRAAHCYNLFTAFNAREHNNANVLTLGGKVIGPELAKKIVQIFLETQFGGGRHAKRVDKIMEIEANYSKK